MKKIEITLYQFSELSEEAKQNALSNYQSDTEYTTMHDYEYLLSEEAYSEHCQVNEIYFDQQGNIF